MSGRDELRAWIRENMPELNRDLQFLTWDDVRVKMNELTGLHLTSTDPIDAGSLRYLEALKARKDEK